MAFIRFHSFLFHSFPDRGSKPSSPSTAENPLDAAVKARRKDQDEEKEAAGIISGSLTSVILAVRDVRHNASQIPSSMLSKLMLTGVLFSLTSDRLG